MDSRIREIEQWVTEAKNDLGECGREAYINKLYLLDAEIRAIIKEDGSLHAAGSPRQRQGHVRRFGVPVISAVGIVGVLLLAASTAYLLTELNSLRGLQLAQADPPAPIAASQPASTYAGHVPANIPGEEILPAGWRPPAAEEQPAVPDAEPVVLLASHVPAPPPTTAPTHPAAAQAPATTANDATSVVATVPTEITPPPAGHAIGVNVPGSGSSLGSGDGGNERIVAAVSNYDYFPEAETEAADEPGNQAFDALKESRGTSDGAAPAEITVTGDEPVDNGDNSENTDEAEAGDDEPLLDKDALAEKLKDKLDQPDKS
jgi:hypothetical protein